MYKAIPEIRISTTDTNNVSENELLSDIATDCELLDTQSNTFNSNNTLLNINNSNEDELLTDLDGSSSDEDLDNKNNLEMNYPLESLNRVFDIGMNCEEITNCKGPTKSHRTISFDKIKLNELKQNENLTDTEDFFGSDIDSNENNRKKSSIISTDYLETSNFVKISDHVVGPKKANIITPIHTPEPDDNEYVSGGKIRSVLNSSTGLANCLTDVEILLSDDERQTGRKKLASANKLSKNTKAICTSDTDEESLPKKRSTQVSSTILATGKKFNQLQAKKEDAIVTTDVEMIEFVDNKRSKPTKKPLNTRKFSSTKKTFEIKNGKSNVNVQQKGKYSIKKCLSVNGREMITRSPDFKNRLTDVEQFDSEEEEDMNIFDKGMRYVSYLPPQSCDLVLTSENYKGGGVSLVMPIKESATYKNLLNSNTRNNDQNLGLSETEDLPDFEQVKFTFCKTPDLQLDENTIIKSVDNLIYTNLLKPKLLNTQEDEPLTDIEEIDLPRKFNDQLNIRSSISPLPLNLKESYTDVEDLSDTEEQCLNENANLLGAAAVEYSITDEEILSGDDNEDDEMVGYQYTARTPDIQMLNSYVASKEGVGPFPAETKENFNKLMPKLRMLTPSPVPFNNTDTEELLGSTGEEENEAFLCAKNSNHCGKFSTDDEDDDTGKTIEPHISVVHIKHTRKFQMDGTESLHIKYTNNQPEPLTDVEEFLAPTDDFHNDNNNLGKKMRHSHQHSNRWSSHDDSSVCFNKASTGAMMCKWKTKRRAICSRREERDATGGDKISQHKPVIDKITKTQSPVVTTQNFLLEERVAEVKEQEEGEQISDDMKLMKLETLAQNAIPQTCDTNTKKTDVDKKLKEQFINTEEEEMIMDKDEQVPSSPVVTEVNEGEIFLEEQTIITKPYVTTPTQSRRVSGIGGSQRLSREERPTVRIVTDFVEDSDTESEPENYIVTEPAERTNYPTRRGVKFRFDSEDYREDRVSDGEDEIEQVIIEEEVVENVEVKLDDDEPEEILVVEKKLTKTERRFERMASSEGGGGGVPIKESDGEFQKIVSQLSTEEVNQALEQWEKEGLTPSEGDSKETTTEGSSEHFSPTMQGETIKTEQQTKDIQESRQRESEEEHDVKSGSIDPKVGLDKSGGTSTQQHPKK